MMLKSWMDRICWEGEDEGAGGGGTDGAGSDTQTTNTEAQNDKGEGAGSEGDGTVLGGGDADDTSSKPKPDGKDDTAGDDKPKEGEGEPDPLDTVPEDGKYDFGELPEGMTLDEALVEKMAPAFKEAGLTTRQVQQLAPVYAAVQQEMAQAQVAEFTEAVTKWKDEAKADPLYKAKGWDDAVAVANKGLNAFGTPELKAALKTTGMGNHPELIKAFYKIGLTVADDTTTSEPKGGTSEVPVEERMYGKTTPKQRT